MCWLLIFYWYYITGISYINIHNYQVSGKQKNEKWSLVKAKGFVWYKHEGFSNLQVPIFYGKITAVEKDNMTLSNTDRYNITALWTNTIGWDNVKDTTSKMDIRFTVEEMCALTCKVFLFNWTAILLSIVMTLMKIFDEFSVSNDVLIVVAGS